MSERESDGGEGTKTASKGGFLGTGIKPHLPSAFSGSHQDPDPGIFNNRDAMHKVKLPVVFHNVEKLNSAELEEALTSPTPDDLWWDPLDGWPAGAKLDGKKPPEMLPTTRSKPFLQPKEKDIIGEVRVEILECAGLPSFDTFSATDAYCMVACESFCARTHTVRNAMAPVWMPNMPRAFKMPITRPFSKLFVALLDEESGPRVDSDDPIGRIALELHVMYPRTEYTAWFPLQKKTLQHHVGRNGRLRLRYSVLWKSDKYVLTNYFSPVASSFLVPLTKSKDLRALQFATKGSQPENVYNYKILKEHVAELTGHVESLKTVLEAAKRVLFWKYPRINILAGVLWQFLCTHPRFVIAAGPLSFMALLNWTYETGPCTNSEPAACTPSFYDYMRCLIFPGKMGRLPELDAEPVYRHGQAMDIAQYESDVEDEEDEKEQKKEPQPEQKPDEKKEDEDDGADGRTRAQKLAMTLNPMAYILFPVQQILGAALEPVRTIKHIITWNDAPFTADLYLVLFLLSAILAILPWHFIFMWLARIIGVVLWGPHMYFVGKILENTEEKTAEQKQKEKEEAEKKKEEELMQNAESEEEARERKEFFKKSRFRYRVDSTPFFTSKFMDKLDPRRTSARAMNVSYEDTQAIAEQATDKKND